MSTSIYFEATGPVLSPALAAIEDSLQHDANPWWGDGVAIFSNDPVGGSMDVRLRTMAWTADGTMVPVSDADNQLMAWNDHRMFAELLTGWSRRHCMTWAIDLEGEPGGQVTPAGPDDEFTGNIQGLFPSERFGTDMDQAAAEVARVRALYPASVFKAEPE